SREGRLPLGKMGERLMLHQASITNLVDRLEAQDYVRRESHPDDGRVVLAAITDRARGILDDVTHAIVEVQVGVSELDDDDATELMRILRGLRAGAGDFHDP